MALADNKFPVKLDGKGYILQEETYLKKPQEAFTPRFSTGDPSLGDLSFWQFFRQTDFTGGLGQKLFQVTNKFFRSAGWEVDADGWKDWHQ